MAMTQVEAADLLKKYGTELKTLSLAVNEANGLLPERKSDDSGAIYYQQLTSMVYRAVVAIANNTAFKPDLLDESDASPKGNGAFIKGDFGDPSSPHRCLDWVFANMNAPECEIAFKELAKAFFPTRNVFNKAIQAFCDDISMLDRSYALTKH